jgi:hypothetical protein
MPTLLWVTVLLFELLIAGSVILKLFRLRFNRLLTETAVSLGLGAFAWVAALWFLAVIHLYYAPLGWLLMLAVPAIGWREARTWLRRFIGYEWEREYSFTDISLVLGWLLVTYLALNFLTVNRPFPIGWDDLGSYINRPRLLVSYGHFIFSMSPFDWSYLSSLGFLLFGYDSVFGPTAAMMVNWSAGLMAVLMLMASGNAFLGRGRGKLSALLYYSLPLVGHFSFADMKIDNAVFVMGGLGMLLVFMALFPRMDAPDGAADDMQPSEHDGKGWWKLLLLGGIFCGFAFAIKSTAIMVFMPLMGIILAIGMHGAAFAGVAALAFVAFGNFGGFDLNKILMRAMETTIPEWQFVAATVLLGLGLIALGAWRNQKAARPTLLRAGVFLAGFLVAVAPWVIHNNILAGNIVPKFLMGAPNNFSPSIALKGEKLDDHGQPIKVIPPELKLDPNSPFCNATGSIEELDRYWGFEQGWNHYTTLPWRTVMNLDSWGYYVTTMPSLLLFPLVLLLPLFWLKRGRWLRWLSIGTAFMVVEWIFVANGIPWYGLGMFYGLVLVLETFVARAPDLPSRWLAGTLISLSLLSNFSMRLWQFDQQRNILEYSFGKISALALEELTIPHYNDIRIEVEKRFEENPERPYLYRVGTFIPYFIPKNLERIGLNDHQLDVFNCINQERNHALTTKRLKSLGFNAIIFDTNTASIEQDQNGSLHKKVKAFEDYANDPASGVQIMLNDPNAGVAYIAIP